MAVAPAAIIHQVMPAHRAKSCGFEAWPSHCWLVSVMQACRKESLAEPPPRQSGDGVALAAMPQLLCNLGTNSASHSCPGAHLLLYTAPSMALLMPFPGCHRRFPLNPPPSVAL